MPSTRSASRSPTTRSASARAAQDALPVALARSDIPGVYRNSVGALVDDRGIVLSWAQLKAADDARWTEAAGSPPRTPAELLRAVAMDPRHSLDLRLSAARQAAPYFDMRMPLRVEATGTVGAGLDLNLVAKMPSAERKMLLDLLKKTGIEL